METEIARAIKERLVITCTYDGHSRTAEPHLLGTEGKTHALTVEVFQTHGGSVTGGIPDWRHFIVADISHLTVNSEHFAPSIDFKTRKRWRTVLDRV